MNRTTELAAQAIKRIEMGWAPVESVAQAIRTALAEAQGAGDQAAGLPPAMASAVALMRRLGHITPRQLARLRGTKDDAARFLMARLLRRRVVVRVRRGEYVLTLPWRDAEAGERRRIERLRMPRRRPQGLPALPLPVSAPQRVVTG